MISATKAKGIKTKHPSSKASSILEREAWEQVSK
jgi:hypothetical protein